MDEEPDWAAGDPEIAALLNFTPVPRGVKRADGWDPASQRGFIAWLAARGNVIAAARAIERSESGAKQLRREDETGEFDAAWRRAIALYRSRNGAAGPRPPQAPPFGNRHARRAQQAQARRHGYESQADEEAPELEEAEKAELLDEILQRYVTKLAAERTARLAGRIVEADFYVRQLTFIELVLDVGGRAQELLSVMSWDGLHLLQVSATPGSALLERRRRAFWLEKGEADRPPPAPLGRHNELFSTGRDDYDPTRDGDRKEWERKQDEKRRLAAEAQKEWEARARAEADTRRAPANDDEPDEAGGDSGP
jgi:hypothetical protein